MFLLELSDKLEKNKPIKCYNRTVKFYKAINVSFGCSQENTEDQKQKKREVTVTSKRSSDV